MLMRFIIILKMGGGLESLFFNIPGRKKEAIIRNSCILSTVRKKLQSRDKDKIATVLRVSASCKLRAAVPPSAQLEPEMAKGLSQKAPWVYLSANGPNLSDVHRISTTSLRKFSSWD